MDNVLDLSYPGGVTGTWYSYVEYSYGETWQKRWELDNNGEFSITENCYYDGVLYDGVVGCTDGTCEYDGAQLSLTVPLRYANFTPTGEYRTDVYTVMTCGEELMLFSMEDLEWIRLYRDSWFENSGTTGDSGNTGSTGTTGKVTLNDLIGCWISLNLEGADEYTGYEWSICENGYAMLVITDLCLVNDNGYVPHLAAVLMGPYTYDGSQFTFYGTTDWLGNGSDWVGQTFHYTASWEDGLLLLNGSSYHYYEKTGTSGYYMNELRGIADQTDSDDPGTGENADNTVNTGSSKLDLTGKWLGFEPYGNEGDVVRYFWMFDSAGGGYIHVDALDASNGWRQMYASALYVGGASVDYYEVSGSTVTMYIGPDEMQFDVKLNGDTLAIGYYDYDGNWTEAVMTKGDYDWNNLPTP